MDYAEKDGVYFFVVVDAQSNWPEVFSTSSTTTHKTIEMLSHLFAAYGLPEEIVLDNGPQFVSDEMLHFMKKHGIQRTRVPRYHPASNGEAERYVQILKQTLRTSNIEPGKSLQLRRYGTCNFRGKDKWQRGTMILRIGPLAYQVRVGERMCHVYIDHLLHAGDAEFTSNTPEQKVIPLTSVEPPPVLPVPSGVTPSKSLEPTSPGPSDPGPTPIPESAATNTSPDPPRRYPKRSPKPVKRLG
ncbi:uncharacterized protein LOC122953784 [Acropora millepora]|uniref:uncharacterized protein LOC122953784 n=1 Tax=Acropora millepora TaxID=45264 RepID=UPI001CF3CC02|nr:uncharacterized protein LOC122953784 [Acropora millepora]